MQCGAARRRRQEHGQEVASDPEVIEELEEEEDLAPVPAYMLATPEQLAGMGRDEAAHSDSDVPSPTTRRTPGSGGAPRVRRRLPGSEPRHTPGSGQKRAGRSGGEKQLRTPGDRKPRKSAPRSMGKAAAVRAPTRIECSATLIAVLATVAIGRRLVGDPNKYFGPGGGGDTAAAGGAAGGDEGGEGAAGGRAG